MPEHHFHEQCLWAHIEYWIEGDANAQRRLNAERWNGRKAAKKIGKHLTFLLLSILIAHVVMAYIIGIEETLIDCKLCVHVCPTGIDIRNGTQLECVNCTACIDACDEVMVKIQKPKGLIRYASHNSIQNGIQKLLSQRVAGYSLVLLALIAILGFTLNTRSDVETTILKVPGTLYQRNEDGTITNLYNVTFINKTFSDLPLELKIESHAQASLFKPDAGLIRVPADGQLKTIYFIKIPQRSIITTARTDVVIGVYSQGKKVEEVKVKFIGPLQVKKQ